VLLPLLAGEPVAFSGETVRAAMSLTTPRVGRVPVLIAALGERMLRLAGERTDGTVLWMTGAATIRDHIVPTIQAAAATAGRPAPRVVARTPVCVTTDPEAAQARAAKVFAIYGTLPSYRAMLDREGAAGPADIALIGDEDTVTAGVDELADAGTTDFVASQFSTGPDDARRTRELLSALARRS
jgi:5,10-methylenetetrahydromethanopterin reductase